MRRRASGERYLVRYRNAGVPRARTFDTKPDAARWKALLDAVGPDTAERVLDDPEARAAVTQDLTVASWVARHIDALSGVEGGTRRDYRSYLKHDIAPTPLGALPLPAVNREVVGAWVNGLADRGLSGKTIRNRHSLLSAALTSAVQAEHITTNHAKGVRLPDTSHTREDMVVLSEVERRRLVGCLPEHYRPLATFLLLTGLRWGEATALTVGNVDFDGAVLHVRQAWKHTGDGTMVLGPPKTKRGRRAVSLTATAVGVLRAVTEGRAAGEYVFTTPRGFVLRQGTFYGRVWQPAVRAFAGDVPGDGPGGWVPGPGKRPRVHDLRHTHASALIAAGVPLTHLQRRLGHESIKTTSDTYGHLLPGAHDEMIRAVDAAFTTLEEPALTSRQALPPA